LSDQGNFVAEWFGHRVYPIVSRHPSASVDQLAARCPFLSAATREDRQCIKSAAALGVCTISSSSNGTRQDWLVCPYRAVDPLLILDVVDRLFGVEPAPGRVVAPGPTLSQEDVRSEILARTAAGGSAVIFLQDKLGGEISLPRTPQSPELSFDITLVEVRRAESKLDISQYGILEVQTMDFHGSYRSAVQNLQDALRLHGEGFPDALAANSRWLRENVEGPNIANVFKRTFYQMMLKFQIGSLESCAGCVLALPQSVWDSWQRHLGAPELLQRPDGDFALKRPGTESGEHPPAWIYIFDIDTETEASPSPIVIRKRIATDADSVGYFALKVAPAAAVGQSGSSGLVTDRIKLRLSRWWPQLWRALAE